MLPAENNYIFPHHAVLKPTSSTTKLRVVFDGSALTSNGLSINNVTKTGPNVQSDYLQILMRFRFWKYAFTCDVKKMYRQIQGSQLSTTVSNDFVARKSIITIASL
jgi:hypothetical protein